MMLQLGHMTKHPRKINDWLHAGPPLQNQLWSVMVRAGFHPLLTTYRRHEASLLASQDPHAGP